MYHVCGNKIIVIVVIIIVVISYNSKLSHVAKHYVWYSACFPYFKPCFNMRKAQEDGSHELKTCIDSANKASGHFHLIKCNLKHDITGEESRQRCPKITPYYLWGLHSMSDNKPLHQISCSVIAARLAQIIILLWQHYCRDGYQTPMWSNCSELIEAEWRVFASVIKSSFG